jgi:hypothetical protein
VVPFAATKEERESSGDPRPSIEERYASKDGYLATVRQAAEGMVAERFILEEDINGIVEGAGARWDAFLQAGHEGEGARV